MLKVVADMGVVSKTVTAQEYKDQDLGVCASGRGVVGSWRTVIRGWTTLHRESAHKRNSTKSVTHVINEYFHFFRNKLH